MRETSPRGWHRRLSVVKPTPAPFDYMTRLSTAPAIEESAEMVGAGSANRREKKGPDGIRHELVARIRKQIADGTYDTEEKWLLAEEALLRRIEGCA